VPTLKVLGFASSSGLSGTENDVAKNQQFAEKIKKAFQEGGRPRQSVSLAVPAEGAMIRISNCLSSPKRRKNAVRFRSAEIRAAGNERP